MKHGSMDTNYLFLIIQELTILLKYEKISDINYIFKKIASQIIYL